MSLFRYDVVMTIYSLSWNLLVGSIDALWFSSYNHLLWFGYLLIDRSLHHVVRWRWLLIDNLSWHDRSIIYSLMLLWNEL